jgi:hypothetical protein
MLRRVMSRCVWSLARRSVAAGATAAIPLVFFVGAAAVPLACGSRTGLLVTAALDAAASAEAGDSGEPEADVADAPEPVDAVFPDVSPVDVCPDAGSTLIYVITEENDLFSFYPPTLEFQLVGPLSCATAAAAPFSMAVDRRGVGYSVFTDGSLYRVDMASAACERTSYVVGQQGFLTFGMGFVANAAGGDAGDGGGLGAGDAGGAGETLFVAEGSATTAIPRPDSKGLAVIDPTTLQLQRVAGFMPPIPGPELTGTGAGTLFGFYTNAAGAGSHVVQLDPATGVVMDDHPLQTGQAGDGYAFAYWGGSFYIFTDPAGGATTVTRYTPSTGEETDVAQMPEGVVGAGVSTCAP